MSFPKFILNTVMPIILFLLTACSHNAETLPEEETNKSGSESVSNYYLEEVSKHDSSEDCWLAIEGKVYDVSPYIADKKHPGGKAILEGCGKEATELFNTRPMGSGTPHSDRARSGLENFYIGDLVE